MIFAASIVLVTACVITDIRYYFSQSDNNYIQYAENFLSEFAVI